jgi:hypothetical protein
VADAPATAPAADREASEEPDGEAGQEPDSEAGEEPGGVAVRDVGTVAVARVASAVWALARESQLSMACAKRYSFPRDDRLPFGVAIPVAQVHTPGWRIYIIFRKWRIERRLLARGEGDQLEIPVSLGDGGCQAQPVAG